MGGLSVTGEMAELDGDAAWRDDGQAANGALPRLLPPAPVRELHVHEARYGEPRLRGTALIDEVTRAGLTGRGGAAFPAGSKLSSVRERAGLRGAVLVANGMESEPASAKDAALLARTPHLVLDGIALAAEAAGAKSAYLCVRRQAQADMLSAAIAERGGRDPVQVKLVLVPERYVSSAESALVRYLNGGPALPGSRRRGPSSAACAPADAGQQRGDPGQHRADQPARCGLVQLCRHGNGAGVGARHRGRRGQAAWRARDSLRHAGP